MANAILKANRRPSFADPYQTNVSEFVYVKETVAFEPLPRRICHPPCCKICGEDALLIPAEDAARISRLSRRVIYRWIECGALHFIETPDGEVLVCGSSLARTLDEQEYATNRL